VSGSRVMLRFLSWDCANDIHNMRSRGPLAGLDSFAKATLGAPRVYFQATA